MNRLARRQPPLRGTLACVLAAFVAACASAPPPLAEPAPRASASRPVDDAASAPPARVVRFYRDERGQLWDDQGRRVDEPR